MEAALGATTPDVPVAPLPADAGQPAQPQGGMPEGQQPDLQAQPEPTQEEQWFLKAETGTVYKTAEAAAAGIAEKDRFIQQLLSERSQWQNQQFQQPQTPQASPEDAYTAEVGQMAARIEQRLMAMPKYQAYDREAIRQEAELQAIAVLESRDVTLQAYQQQAIQQQQQAFIEQHKAELYSDIGQRLYAERRFNSPQEHLDAIHAEMYRMSRQQPQAQGGVGVQGAMQATAQRQQVFANPNGGGTPPQGAPLSERVQRAIEEGRKMGFDDAALERVKQRAIENEARMARR